MYNVITGELKVPIDRASVLDKGFVRLDDYMADDLSVVNSARVSFNNRHEVMEEGDDKLIGFLMKNRHGTPFEHNSFRFHIKAPLFVFREWQRHRIASYNEWSARYSELKPEFYIPSKENVRKQVGKPGAYRYVPLDEQVTYGSVPLNEDWGPPGYSKWGGRPKSEIFIEQLEDASKEAYRHYDWAMRMGVAKEQARMFLPVNIYSEMYYTVNARSLMNFLSLRNAESAQWEIRQYAGAIEDLWKDIMPITYKTFIENGRVAP
jgi:thymidylate synthase (FAD)